VKFLTVCFVGWVDRAYTIDMSTTVPWPDMTPEALEATITLGDGTLESVLKACKCKDALQLMGWIEGMRMRAKIGLDEVWFSHTEEVSRAEIEHACWQRMESIDNESVHHGRIDDLFDPPF